MENCSVCKHKGINTLGSGFLCKIHGPVLGICLCKEFEPDELKIKVRKCYECGFFKLDKTPDNTGKTVNPTSVYGTCLKYLLRKYDGSKRNSCSQFIEESLNNITNVEYIG